MATAALNSSKDILFSDPLHYVTSKNNNIYFAQNGTLYKRTLADPIAGNSAVNTCPPSPSDSCADDRELVHDVTEFSVRYFDNQDNEVAPSLAQSVEITLELDKVKYGKNISADYTTRTVFRNE